MRSGLRRQDGLRSLVVQLPKRASHDRTLIPGEFYRDRPAIWPAPKALKQRSIVMKKLVILSGLIAVIGLSAPASLTFAASKSKSPSVSGPPKVMTKPPAGKTTVRPPGKGGITPRPSKTVATRRDTRSPYQKCEDRCDNAFIRCLPPQAAVDNPLTGPVAGAIEGFCAAKQWDCRSGCVQRH
jgi:hypothetical protein